VSTVIAFRFKLSKENHQRIKEEVARLKEGGQLANTDPETKKVLHALTGLPHEKLWS